MKLWYRWGESNPPATSLSERQHQPGELIGMRPVSRTVGQAASHMFLNENGRVALPGNGSRSPSRPVDRTRTCIFIRLRCSEVETLAATTGSGSDVGSRTRYRSFADCARLPGHTTIVPSEGIEPIYHLLIRQLHIPACFLGLVIQYRPWESNPVFLGLKGTQQSHLARPVSCPRRYRTLWVTARTQALPG